MLLPPAMRDQDRQPSNPFGARKPRPDEVNQTAPEPWRVVNGIATIAGRKRTELPEPKPQPQHISDHDMIRRDLGMAKAEWRPCYVHQHNDLTAILSGDGWGVWIESAAFQRDPDDILDPLPGDPVEVLIDEHQNALAWRRRADVFASVGTRWPVARLQAAETLCNITLDTTSITS